MSCGYDSERTSVHFIGYHFVWCPKYRRNVLVDGIDLRLKELLYLKAEEIGCKVIAIEVMPDHVHIFIQGNPKLAPNQIIWKLKGYTSHELRKEFNVLRTRLPTLWTRSYFVSTHGHVSDETIKRYIDEQKGM